jgi:hypothetical protein
MRRLDILLAGQSQALTDLALELEQHGHALTRMSRLEEHRAGASRTLVIDDCQPELAQACVIRPTTDAATGHRPARRIRACRRWIC